MPKTTFSVIMPVYNAEKYLDESILSVLNQTYKNWELIVVDDASTDKSLSVIKKHAKFDKRIKILTNSVSRGAGISRNLAVDSATGEYLMFLDADDMYNPALLQRIADVTKKFKPDIIEFPFSVCNENGTDISPGWGKNYSDGFIDIKNYWMMYATCLWCCAFNKKFITDNEIKNSSVKSGEDNNFSIPAFCKAQTFYFVNLENAYMYRHVENSLSNAKVDVWQHILNQAHVYEILKKDLVRLGVFDQTRFDLMALCSYSWQLRNKVIDRKSYNHIRKFALGLRLDIADFERYNCMHLYHVYRKLRRRPYLYVLLKSKGIL